MYSDTFYQFCGLMKNVCMTTGQTQCANSSFILKPNCRQKMDKKEEKHRTRKKKWHLQKEALKK